MAAGRCRTASGRSRRCDVIIAPVEFPPVRCYNRRPGVSIHAVTSEKVLLVITPFQRTIRDLLNVIGWAAMPIARSATHHVPLVPPPCGAAVIMSRPGVSIHELVGIDPGPSVPAPHP